MRWLFCASQWRLAKRSTTRSRVAWLDCNTRNISEEEIMRMLIEGSKRAGLAALIAVTLWTPALAWEPTKPVEIVVPAGAGGASDQMARVLQNIIGKYKLMKQPVIIQLKGGSS